MTGGRKPTFHLTLTARGSTLDVLYTSVESDSDVYEVDPITVRVQMCILVVDP